VTDTSYRPLADEQYEAIILAGEMDGNVSPLRGSANWQALESASKDANIDGRIALTGTLFEDHEGTDPAGGIALAKVYNFGGIKWAGQPGAYDSGIPCPPNEGGTYAGFKDFGGFASELYRTLTNQYCGPFFSVGDLANAWSVYVTGKPGSASGQQRADQLDYYRAKYPPAGSASVAQGVYGEDLLAKFRTQIGVPRSGAYDALNGDHPWAYWCRAGVESTGRNCGLSVVAHTSALAAQNAAADQGLLNTTDPPEHSAVVQLDQRFYYPDGHTGYWDADRGMMLCTLTDGTGVGYRNWGPGTYGYVGWYRLPGVVAPRRAVAAPPAPPPATNLVIPGNPYNAGRVAPHEIGVGGGVQATWEKLGDRAMQALGWPVDNERQAIVTEPDGRTSKQRTVQEFERAILIFIPENDPAWQIVAAMRGQTITMVPR
jgi:hypothetical protein